MEPLFPRLHVKDTEKGGPKAPPRNKMAVYEELATPPSRLALGSGARLSLHSNDDGQMGHVHGGELEKRNVSSFYGPPASTTHTTPRLTSSCSSDGIFSKTLANSTPRSVGYVSLSVSKNSLPSKFVRVERRFSNEEGLEAQCESKSSSHNMLKRANVVDLDPDDHAKMSPPNDQSSSPECQRSSKKLASVSAVRANALSNESSKSLLRNVASESSDNAIKDPRSEEPKVSSSLRTDSCLVPSITNNNVALKNESRTIEESDNRYLCSKVPHKNENSSNTRDLDRKSIDISPDDAVLKIGHENFWKTRRILINQQRVLSFQVFELHRIVKVQKSLASSPQDFIEDNLCVQKGFHEVPNIEELPPPPLPPPSLPPRPLPPPPLAPIQPKNKRVKMPFPPFLYDPESFSKQNTRFNPPPSPPPTLANNFNKSRSVPPSYIRPQITTPPMNSLEKMLPTCFYPPPGNQLLAPVMSSEGLVYKPYTGTCPPNVGFTPHLYGSCGPMNGPTPTGSYFLNAAYGILPSQREMMAPGIPIALSYADPCGFSTTHNKVVNEVQGSSESNSVGRDAPSSHDTLPLFPMEPTKARKLELAVPTFENGGGDKEMRAIKPMPLDGRQTNESAMRIFRSIQEERRQTNVD